MRQRSLARARSAARGAWLSSGLALVAAPARAADGGLETGDTAWILVSTALVLLMTIPGLAHIVLQEEAGYRL